MSDGFSFYVCNQVAQLSLTYMLEKLGIQNVGDDTFTEILKDVKAMGIEKRSLLTIDEFKDILNCHAK